jgi:hypothetical protein
LVQRPGILRHVLQREVSRCGREISQEHGIFLKVSIFWDLKAERKENKSY